MSNQRPSVSYHRVVTVALILLNLLAAGWAIYAGSSGPWDYHFREESFVTWLGSAQMFGAALLFLACYFAGTIIRLQPAEERDNTTWLVFALGFFILALDQRFRIREQLTLLIDGVPASMGDSNTPLLIKLGLTVLAIAVVGYFRSTVLANFRMVVAFLGGFWFLITMLLVNVLFESMGWSAQLAKVFEGTGKLLAMAMFLSGSYVALLDRLSAANAVAQLGFFGERRRRQVSIPFPDRRAKRAALARQADTEEKPVTAEPVLAAVAAAPAAATDTAAIVAATETAGAGAAAPAPEAETAATATENSEDPKLP